MSQPQFIDVNTKSIILSTTMQEPFITVNTEPSLSDSSSSHSSHSIPSPSDLIKLYDSTFNEAELYEEFIAQELKQWKDNVELKYFNHLYKEHQNMTASIKSMRL